jgi:DNA-binding FadR family transcriptional regulator
MDGNMLERYEIGATPQARTAKVGEQAAKRLADQILTNDIPPGTVLSPERELAEMLGIGRGTMREALRILEIFGVVDMRTGRYGGPVVSRPDDDDIAKSLTLAFQAEGSTMLDVVETREIIEAHLVRLAARKITTDELERLDATTEAMRVEGLTSDAFQALAREFHSLVARAARSPVLRVFAAGLHKIGGGDVVGIQYGPLQIEHTARAHEEIAIALRQRDGELAAKLWSKHLEAAKRYWMRQFPDEVHQIIKWAI